MIYLRYHRNSAWVQVQCEKRKYVKLARGNRSAWFAKKALCKKQGSTCWYLTGWQQERLTARQRAFLKMLARTDIVVLTTLTMDELELEILNA